MTRSYHVAMSANGSRRDRAAATIATPMVRPIVRRAPRWRGLLVLNYHRIGDPEGQPWDHSLWSASAEALDEQLATLARHAEVIGPEDVEPALRSGRRGRRVMLTFDDGYRDNFELAYPLLRRHGLSATFFLTTGFLDSPFVPWWDEISWMVRNARAAAVPAGGWLDGAETVDLAQPADAIATLVARCKQLPGERVEAFLDHVAGESGSGRCDADASALWVGWEMARQMRDGGMTIGGHTVTHPVLSSVPLERQRQEIDGCAARLRQELGQEMRWFAYPVGGIGTFTEETKDLLRARGVRLAFSFHGGHGRFSRWDPLSVPRVHVGRGHGAELLHAMVLLPRLFARR
jgi:peptidoglycan/xylan/chitin deacetylase (PgdA/CDA1 family)